MGILTPDTTYGGGGGGGGGRTSTAVEGGQHPLDGKGGIEGGERRGVCLDKGVVVETGAVVEAAFVGEGSVIEVGATVGRGCVIGKVSFLFQKKNDDGLSYSLLGGHFGNVYSRLCNIFLSVFNYRPVGSSEFYTCCGSIQTSSPNPTIQHFQPFSLSQWISSIADYHFPPLPATSTVKLRPCPMCRLTRLFRTIP